MEDEEQPTQTTSLFAAFVDQPPSHALPTARNSTSAAEWLQNSSFNTDLSVINDAVSKYNVPYEEHDEEEDKREELNSEIRRPQYETVPSSPSDASAYSDEERRKKRRKKKKRRKEELSTSYSYAATLSSNSRKVGVSKWASSSTANEKEYYFDSRGDPDNLAFGSIYR